MTFKHYTNLPLREKIDTLNSLYKKETNFKIDNDIKDKPFDDLMKTMGMK